VFPRDITVIANELAAIDAKRPPTQLGVKIVKHEIRHANTVPERERGATAARWVGGRGSWVVGRRSLPSAYFVNRTS
jgi:hypothetical protein